MTRRAIARTRGEGGSDGFTLVEILVVILVLGILASIVVFSLTPSAQESAREACRSSFKTVETAAEAYEGEVGTYPSSLTSLTGTAPGLTVPVAGPWLKSLPPIYSPGAAPSISDGEPYGFFVGPGGSSIGVGTIRANGAEADSGTPAVAGDANCASA